MQPGAPLRLTLLRALQASAFAPGDELDRHLATPLVDHLLAEHDGAFALALGRFLVGIQNRPCPVELLLGRREHLVQDRDLVRVERPLAVIARMCARLQ